MAKARVYARAFWFHYNKPASRAQKRNVLTLHYQGHCVLVYNIDCLVPLVTRHRKTQPFCVMAGKGTVTIIHDKAFIT